MTDQLAAELAKLTPDQRRLLLRRLRTPERVDPASAAGPDRRQPDGGTAPLSSSQERFWLLESLSPKDPAYSVPFAVRISGPCDLPLFERALSDLIERHEALRTTFEVREDQARQRVQTRVTPRLRHLDLRSLPPAERSAAVRRHSAALGASGFDLKAELPHRLLLVRLADDEHLLLGAVHHIVFDATSVSIFVEELAALYHAATTGAPASLPELSVQFPDYCQWERDRRSALLTEQLPYWVERLSGAPAASTVRPDHPRATAAGRTAGELSFSLPTDLPPRLSELIHRERITLYAAVLTALSLVLHQFNRQDRLLIGVPTGSRTHPQLHRVIGCFYNPQALRVDLFGDPTLRELLQQAHRTVGEAHSHADVPFADIVRALRPVRSDRYNPLFQTMLSLVELPDSTWHGEGTRFELAPSPPAATDMDIFITLSRHPDGSLAGICRYATELYRPETIQEVVDTLAGMLHRICGAPQQRVSAVVEPAAGGPTTKPDRTAAGDRPPAAPYREAGTDLERRLAAVWAQVLQLDRVGIDDNFFHLGGDSMQVIQIIAQAATAGISIRPQDLVAQPTIAGLAGIAGSRSVPSARLVPQQRKAATPGSGPVPITPAQAWFLDQVAPLMNNPNHFNHSYYLRLTDALPPGRVEEAVHQLAQQHDSLRLRLTREGQQWQQSSHDPAYQPPFASHDLTELSPSEQDAAAAAIAAAAQTQLSLADGMLRVEHFRMRPGQPDRLLLVLHHLIVDALSKPLILQTLRQVLDGAAEPPLPPATYRDWATSLREYAHRGSLAEQLPFWLAQHRAESIPVDRASGTIQLGARERLSITMPAVETDDLQRRARSARVGLGDALLAAVTYAVARWQDSEHACLAVAAPGREPFHDGLDVSRTVGWFQIFYPLRLSAPDGPPLLPAARSIRERVDAVPLRGLGHGLLLSTPAEPAARHELLSVPRPQISFNYLGDLGSVGPGSAGQLLVPADAPAGPPQDPTGGWPYLLDVTSASTGGQLRFAVHYSPAVHDRSTIERLAEATYQLLREESGT